jgi:predicted kinase
VEPDELAQLGSNLARIHEQLPRVDQEQQFGAAAFVRAAMLENLEQVEKLSRSAGLRFDGASLASAMRRALDESATLMEARRAAGHVRECHGDLHCRNVVRRAGRLVAFDGLEFEPAFRWIDVAEEIAFLFMDLLRRSARAQASAFLNGYLSEGGDYEAVRLLRLYGAHRSLVRAKVAALGSAAQDHQSHVDCARALLTPRQPSLVLMSGLSGSGKTWLAARLANRVGAVHVRSDIERRRLAGLHAQSRSGSGVDQGLYARDINERTYRRLAQCAADVLSGRFTAILDATFQRRADRALVSRLAASQGARLILIRCRAPVEVLRARVRDRHREGSDASEADLAVLERQQATFETVDPGEGLEVIDVDTTRAGIVAEVEGKLTASV